MTELTPFKREKLKDLENIIQEGKLNFLRVGRALQIISRYRLYRETHDTFDSYCREVFSFTSQHGYRQIEAAHIANVLPEGAITNESQARALRDLKSDPLLQQAYRIAAQVSPTGEITSMILKATADTIQEIITTKGYVDLGDGESTPLDAAIIQEVSERIERQKQHIRDRSNNKPIGNLVETVGADGEVKLKLPETAGKQIRIIIYEVKENSNGKPTNQSSTGR